MQSVNPTLSDDGLAIEAISPSILRYNSKHLQITLLHFD